MKIKRHILIKAATVSESLDYLLKGQLKYLNKEYDVIALASGIDSLKVVKEREGVKVINVRIFRQINLLSDLVSLINVYFILKNVKPTIVHSITPKAGLLFMVAAYFAKVPIRIHTFTGLVFPSKTGMLQRLLIFMDRVLCFCGTAIYPEGQGVKNDLINYKITRKPLKIIGNGNGNGIDTSYFSRSALNESEIQQIRNIWQIKFEDFVFVFIGRLVKDKGINELVSAFIQVNQQHPQTKLLLVGGEEKELDPLKPETIGTIKNHPNIISTGFQPDVRLFLAVSYVLVFPSYREGFPNVVMQAGAMGLPCIVTNINGCNEIIEDGNNGVIIEPKNEKELEDAMSKLIIDTELRKTLAENSRKMIVNRFEQKYFWNELLKEYQSLLKAKGI